MDFRGPGWKQICRRVEPQEFSGNGDGDGVARLGCSGWLEWIFKGFQAEMNQQIIQVSMY